MEMGIVNWILDETVNRRYSLYVAVWVDVCSQLFFDTIWKCVTYFSSNLVIALAFRDEFLRIMVPLIRAPVNYL